MAGFEIRSRRTLLEAGFLTVSEDDVATPDGETVTRFTVHHPGAVAMVAVDDRRVALVRQFRVGADRELLELPAGKRERGELPEETAARELIEEVALAPGSLERIAEFYNSPGFCDEHTYVYLARDCRAQTNDFEAKAEERHMRIEWVDLAAVDALIDGGDIADAKTIVGLLRARDRLGGGAPG